MQDGRGAVAAGHPETARVAWEVLGAGGNAFDAALAAVAAACVCEPVLCSLGGGGFLVAVPARGAAVVYDFFAQTPRRRRPAGEVDFHPVRADFGHTDQGFHIGRGSVATPGLVAGLAAVAADLGALPLSEILAPAADLARAGVPVAPLQARILEVVAPIMLHSATARARYESPSRPGVPLQAGEVLRLPDLAATLEALGREGPDLFHRGVIARAIADSLAEGGMVGVDDLANYRVVRRAPLVARHRGAVLQTNPAPALGGPLEAFTLALLGDDAPPGGGPSCPDWLTRLARAMAVTSQARREARLGDGDVVAEAAALLAPESLARWRAVKRGGTTHVSVIDGQGNAAAVTVSNGEGCGEIVPGTDVMLNNMLGEEDINPRGFFNWHPDTRIASMMTPTVARSGDGTLLAVGSGGSNRIRSAVLQVLLNILDFDLGLEAAVAVPRLHMEAGVLQIEGGLPPATVAALAQRHSDHSVWPDRNFFFGGVHVVARDAGGCFAGAGDPRRGGVAMF